jgi:hypothetical protein
MIPRVQTDNMRSCTTKNKSMSMAQSGTVHTCARCPFLFGRLPPHRTTWLWACGQDHPRHRPRPIPPRDELMITLACFPASGDVAVKRDRTAVCRLMHRSLGRRRGAMTMGTWAAGGQRGCRGGRDVQAGQGRVLELCIADPAGDVSYLSTIRSWFVDQQDTHAWRRLGVANPSKP